MKKVTIDDSPTYTNKPQGRRKDIDLFKENKSIIVDINSYRKSINDRNSKALSSNMTEVFEPADRLLKLRPLKTDKIHVGPLRSKLSNYLNTKDIEGARPMKFKHRFKRIVEQANNKSHFLQSGSQLQESAEKPFKPGIRVSMPYSIPESVGVVDRKVKFWSNPNIPQLSGSNLNLDSLYLGNRVPQPIKNNEVMDLYRRHSRNRSVSL